MHALLFVSDAGNVCGDGLLDRTVRLVPIRIELAPLHQIQVPELALEHLDVDEHVVGDDDLAFGAGIINERLLTLNVALVVDEANVGDYIRVLAHFYEVHVGVSAVGLFFDLRCKLQIQR
jgi:hypothetical protein